MEFWILLMGILYIGVLVISALYLSWPDKTLEVERLKKKRYKKLHKDEIQAEKRKKKVQKKIDREVNWHFRRLKKSYARGDDFEVILEPDNCHTDTMVKLIKAEMHRFGLPYVKIEYNRNLFYRKYAAIVYWTEK